MKRLKIEIIVPLLGYEFKEWGNTYESTLEERKLLIQSRGWRVGRVLTVDQWKEVD